MGISRSRISTYSILALRRINNLMKHLLTAIACFLALSMSAQTPYNPDFDNDSLITFNDMLSFLPLYGSEFFPEPVDLMQEQYCIVANNCDTCWVNEDSDVVYLTTQYCGSIGRGPVYLPDGVSLKKVYLFGYEGTVGCNIYVRDSPEDNYYLLINSFQTDDAAIVFRMPSGRWIKMYADN